MTRIDKPEMLSCVHENGRLIAMFTDDGECLAFADKYEKEIGVKLKCDPLYNVIEENSREGYFRGYKEGRTE